jgi:dihydroorotase
MNAYLIYNAHVVNEGREFNGGVLILNGRIEEVFEGQPSFQGPAGCTMVDAANKLLLPGVIDDQVHFRDPGLTHKGDIFTESRAGIAGGVTSFMEMPNTKPQTITQELLADKFAVAASKSLANFSFYMGATNDNIEELRKTDPAKVCGIKVFMGASTGNMLVDNPHSLENIFSITSLPIAVHCEDERTIQHNTYVYKERYGESIPISCHPGIRSEEACFLSSSLAVNLAKKLGTRLHILHLSTARELDLFSNEVPLSEKKITAEVCIHHLWFDQRDYESKGSYIKWNPAIKTSEDREALLAALIDNRIDIVATDHAPHTLGEKESSYLACPSGGPLLQHSLQAMLELWKQGRIALTRVIDKMCHYPAILFNVEQRGFIRKGYWADLVLVDTKKKYTVSKDNILYKCGWSPFEGYTFQNSVTHTFVNGRLVFDEDTIDESVKGVPLTFNR